MSWCCCTDRADARQVLDATDCMLQRSEQLEVIILWDPATASAAPNTVLLAQHSQRDVLSILSGLQWRRAARCWVRWQHHQEPRPCPQRAAP